MIKVAIYARYSTELQREASIEDQIRACQERAKREGWKIVNCYTDHAVSDASLMRPGLQMLMQDGAAGKFNMVVAKALDRLSPDQEDIAGLHKRMQLAGVSVFTRSEGEISSLHIGLKGPEAAAALPQIAGWFEDYTQNHPHSWLRMRSPREFMRGQQQAEVSG